MDDRNRQKLIKELAALGTEQANPDTTDIDSLSPLEICKKINDEDQKVADVVRRALPEIAKAAEIAAKTWKSGGRIVYIGAGTSGRLGVLDAAECPPTFGVDPSQTVGLISGGYDTLILSKEGAEDHENWAVDDLKRIELTANDFVIGIAASVRTPYTQAGIAYAKETGCKTALVVCNDANSLKTSPDILVVLKVGPEAITGSTRMKSGTAQKMTLNMITTTAAVLTGKTYGNLMVDLMARSEKLHARSRKILMEFLNIDYDNAEVLLESADESVKIAIVMKRLGIDRSEAERRLEKADGFLRRVIG